MAIFSKKDTKEKKVTKKADKKADVVKAEVSTEVKSVDAGVAGKTPEKKSVLVGPRVAEKSALLSDKNIYTFVVTKDANKYKVYNAIKNKYKVEAVKINITNLPEKRVFVRGKWGKKSSLKKAVVFLKKGEKIEFM